MMNELYKKTKKEVREMVASEGIRCTRICTSM